ncbi:MAG: hypothetical protein IJA46_06550 [Bacteroidaceae bacterium]|nr:hypothetical protein [Bacteroidaceae bacterium]
MEEKQIALKASLCNRLSQMVLDHNLPVNIVVGEKLTYLRTVILTYHLRDEMLVEWLISRVTEDDEYAV